MKKLLVLLFVAGLVAFAVPALAQPTNNYNDNLAGTGNANDGGVAVGVSDIANDTQAGQANANEASIAAADIFNFQPLKGADISGNSVGKYNDSGAGGITEVQDSYNKGAASVNGPALATVDSNKIGQNVDSNDNTNENALLNRSAIALDVAKYDSGAGAGGIVDGQNFNKNAGVGGSGTANVDSNKAGQNVDSDGNENALLNRSAIVVDVSKYSGTSGSGGIVDGSFNKTAATAVGNNFIDSGNTNNNAGAQGVDNSGKGDFFGTDLSTSKMNAVESPWSVYGADASINKGATDSGNFGQNVNSNGNTNETALLNRSPVLVANDNTAGFQGVDNATGANNKQNQYQYLGASDFNKAGQNIDSNGNTNETALLNRSPVTVLNDNAGIGSWQGLDSSTSDKSSQYQYAGSSDFLKSGTFVDSDGNAQDNSSGVLNKSPVAITNSGKGDFFGYDASGAKFNNVESPLSSYLPVNSYNTDNSDNSITDQRYVGASNTGVGNVVEDNSTSDKSQQNQFAGASDFGNTYNDASTNKGATDSGNTITDNSNQNNDTNSNNNVDSNNSVTDNSVNKGGVQDNSNGLLNKAQLQDALKDFNNDYTNQYAGATDFNNDNSVHNQSNIANNDISGNQFQAVSTVELSQVNTGLSIGDQGGSGTANQAVSMSGTISGVYAGVINNGGLATNQAAVNVVNVANGSVTSGP